MNILQTLSILYDEMVKRVLGVKGEPALTIALVAEDMEKNFLAGNGMLPSKKIETLIEAVKALSASFLRYQADLVLTGHTFDWEESRSAVPCYAFLLIEEPKIMDKMIQEEGLNAAA